MNIFNKMALMRSDNRLLVEVLFEEIMAADTSRKVLFYKKLFLSLNYADTITRFLEGRVMETLFF